MCIHIYICICMYIQMSIYSTYVLRTAVVVTIAGACAVPMFKVHEASFSFSETYISQLPATTLKGQRCFFDGGFR